MYADQPLAYSRMGFYSSQLQGVGFWNTLSTEIANCSGARRGLSYSSWRWFWRISIQACVFSHLSHWVKTPGLECDWVSKAWFNWHCKQLMARFLLEEGYHLPSSQPADWQLMEGGGGGERRPPDDLETRSLCHPLWLHQRKPVKTLKTSLFTV